MSTTMRAAPLGHRLVITALAVHDVVPIRRLAELGLRPGAPVRCLRRTAGGGRIVDIAGARVAIGREILDLITVVEADGLGVVS
ncbi:MAG: ferrous iron transport protein A [Dermatophilaceae bacterium]|nr:ferrous iron transport protein A [Intrasporangiaceae bacterium]